MQFLITHSVAVQKPEKLGEIYDVIKDMDEVEARISPDETMYIINLTGDEAKKF